MSKKKRKKVVFFSIKQKEHLFSVKKIRHQESDHISNRKNQFNCEIILSEIQFSGKKRTDKIILSRSLDRNKRIITSTQVDQVLFAKATRIRLLKVINCGRSSNR